jgi:two-component system response regulator RegA
MTAKILLVDDDESNRITLSVLLEDEGFAVDVAASFAEARAIAANEAARYDLVLLDQHLGDGTGTALLPELRARQPTARVIMISGSLADDAPVMAAFDAVLGKGAEFPDVLALVRATLDGAKPR